MHNAVLPPQDQAVRGGALERGPGGRERHLFRQALHLRARRLDALRWRGQGLLENRLLHQKGLPTFSKWGRGTRRVGRTSRPGAVVCGHPPPTTKKQQTRKTRAKRHRTCQRLPEVINSLLCPRCEVFKAKGAGFIWSILECIRSGAPCRRRVQDEA